MFTLQQALNSREFTSPDMQEFADHMVRVSEGVDFEDDPSDPGGATKCGISLRWAREQGDVMDLNHDGVIDVEDIKLIEPDFAVMVLLYAFFVEPGINKLPASVQKPVFDEAINAGVEPAVELMQKALNQVRDANPALIAMFPKLREDGRIGPKTCYAATVVDAQLGDKQIVNTFCDVRDALYREIAADHPQEERFLKGWEARADSFRIA